MAADGAKAPRAPRSDSLRVIRKRVKYAIDGAAHASEFFDKEWLEDVGFGWFAPFVAPGSVLHHLRKWTYEPRPEVERIVKIIFAATLHAYVAWALMALFLSLYHTGPGRTESQVLDVPAELAIQLELDSCWCHLEAGPANDARVQARSTAVRFWQVAMANWIVRGSKDVWLTVTECETHTVVRCEGGGVRRGYLPAMALRVGGGAGISSLVVAAQGGARSTLSGNAALPGLGGDATLRLQGHALVAALRDVMIGTFDAEVSHGLVDLRGVSFDAAEVKTVDAGVHLELAPGMTSARPLSLNFSTIGDDGGNACLSQAFGGAPAAADGSGARFRLGGTPGGGGGGGPTLRIE